MQCTHMKADGKRCKAAAMKGAEYCFLHNPAISQEHKAELSRKGGLNHAITASDPAADPLRLNTLGDARMLLSETINQVRAGKLDIRVANCIGVLTGHLIKAIETESVEPRLEAIEAALIDNRDGRG